MNPTELTPWQSYKRSKHCILQFGGISTKKGGLYAFHTYGDPCTQRLEKAETFGARLTCHPQRSNTSLNGPAA